MKLSVTLKHLCDCTFNQTRTKYVEVCWKW